MKALTTIGLLILFLTACSGKPDTGPVKVRWDSDRCERCAMAVSDRSYSAQIRGGAVGEKAKAYKFDDIGCALIWLEEQAWKTNPAVEIWVNDYRQPEAWIDATKAWYVKDNITPMDYGLGAQAEPADGALDFGQARQYIFEREKRLNLHSGQPHPTPPAEAIP